MLRGTGRAGSPTPWAEGLGPQRGPAACPLVSPQQGLIPPVHATLPRGPTRPLPQPLSPLPWASQVPSGLFPR